MSKWLESNEKTKFLSLKLNGGDPSLRCCQGDVWPIDRTVERICCLEYTWWMFWVKQSRHLRVGVLSFLCYHVCKTFVKRCLPSHATSCRENKRSEYTTLNFSDSLSIFPLLGLFISLLSPSRDFAYKALLLFSMKHLAPVNSVL